MAAKPKDGGTRRLQEAFALHRGSVKNSFEDLMKLLPRDPSPVPPQPVGWTEKMTFYIGAGVALTLDDDAFDAPEI